MNFKNKIIALVMSFVICFGTISNSFANDKERINNIQPLVVDGGIISAPMLATVAGLAVGTGIVLKNNDDLYDIGRIFYDYIDRHNDLTWTAIQGLFASSVSLHPNNFVSVKGDFLDIVKDFFDNTFSESNTNNKDLEYFGSVPYSPGRMYFSKVYGVSKSLGNNYSYKLNFNSSSGIVEVVVTDPKGNIFSGSFYERKFSEANIRVYDDCLALFEGEVFKRWLSYGLSSPTLTFPYQGGYTWDNVESKREEDKSITLPIPGNLGTLVGQGSTDFWDNTDNLVGGGSISMPGVDSPTIDVSDDVFVGSPSTDVPGVGNPSVPNEGIWATIKDFVVSLVVPSDTFWTDTFNGFRDNFSKNFPMLDMSKFDSLAVGGKPFPNLYAYGSKIVDGDVINSIVDWLRPIIAGFIMICLMFFNYRKIYKLIRNTEPFGSIAQGSSDFRTGLSAPPINNGLDPNPMGNLRDTLFDMRNEILRRENEK